MVKKLVALTGAGAMLLATAGPALAYRHYHHWWSRSDDVSISNYASVYNTVYTQADTGDNRIGGRCVLGGEIETGTATAKSDVLNQVNSNEVSCGCDGDVGVRNSARVRNTVTTRADTGDNSVGGRMVFGGAIGTGNAGATSIVTSVVNTNLVGL